MTGFWRQVSILGKSYFLLSETESFNLENVIFISETNGTKVENEYIENLIVLCDIKVIFDLNDHDTKVLETVINELSEISDIDERMDYVEGSTFYFDLDDTTMSDEIKDELKWLV